MASRSCSSCWLMLPAVCRKLEPSSRTSWMHGEDDDGADMLRRCRPPATPATTSSMRRPASQTCAAGVTLCSNVAPARASGQLRAGGPDERHDADDAPPGLARALGHGAQIVPPGASHWQAPWFRSVGRDRSEPFPGRPERPPARRGTVSVGGEKRRPLRPPDDPLLGCCMRSWEKPRYETDGDASPPLGQMLPYGYRVIRERQLVVRAGPRR